MRPRPSESQLADYQVYYVGLVGDQVWSQAELQLLQLSDIIQSSEGDRLAFAYEEGKWSIRELIVHLCDAERIFGYRALSISRGDTQVLPGFDHNSFVEDNDYSHLGAQELLAEWNAVRNATIKMFKNMNDDQLEKLGNVSDYQNTAWALLHVIVGHTEHHIKILKERYGV